MSEPSPRTNPTQAPPVEVAHVLFMDIVAYSTLAMEQQTRILSELQKIVRETAEFKRALKRHQLLRLATGDGMALVFFGEPEAPVRCALEISRAVCCHPEIKLRMGIHSGPVYRVEDINAARNVSGGGINMAQRVMDCGDAGHILVSKPVADLLNQLESWCPTLHDLGEAAVKHGVRVHLYNLYAGEIGNPHVPQKLRTAAKRKILHITEAVGLSLVLIIGIVAGYVLTHRTRRYAVAPIKGRRSVAVLGFKNLSGNPQTAWLSTALSEMLTTDLAAGERLRTIPGENVARMRQDLSLPDTDSLAEDTLQTVYKNLGSDLVVLGSYLDMGGQVRVDLHLQDAVKGGTLTSVSETGSETQLLDLVNRAGSELRAKCGVGEITPAERVHVRNGVTVNPDATRLYGEGLRKLRLFDALAARDLLEKAVQSEPDAAVVHSALGAAWERLGYDGKSKAEANKAWRLSAGLLREDSLEVEARYRSVNHEYDKAIEVYRSLLNLFPDNIDVGLQLAANQTLAGKAQDAFSTVAALRNLPAPLGTDPRLDLQEAQAAAKISDYSRVESAAANAIRKAQSQGARSLAALGRLKQCQAFVFLSKYTLASTACEDARKAYTAAGDHFGIAQALNLMSAIQYYAGDFVGAEKTLEQALAIDLKVGNESGAAQVLHNIASARAVRGELARAEDAYRQALVIDRRTANDAATATVLANLAWLSMERGDLEAAIRDAQESLRINQDIGDNYGRALALTFLANACSARGQWTQADKAYAQVLELGKQLNDKRELAMALTGRGSLLALTGNTEEAEKHYKQALDLQTSTGNKSDAAITQASLAGLMSDTGRADQALSIATKARDEFRAENSKPDELSAEIVLINAFLEQGRTADAKSELRAAKVLARSVHNYDRSTQLAIVTARVRAAQNFANTNAVRVAKQELLAVEYKAKQYGWIGAELDARFAAAEIEMKSGQSASGRSHLLAVENDARSKGLILVARKAAAAAKR
jgi:tetratricopeptide (TPR) repeat protein/class 3 adenylate cyclase/TolB-like protein